MKIDRHIPLAMADRVKPIHLQHPSGRSADAPRPHRSTRLVALIAWISVAVVPQMLYGQPPNSPLTSFASQPSPDLETESVEGPARSTSESVSRSANGTPAEVPPEQSDPRAVGLLHQVLSTIVHGQPFHAKVRETVWTNGREVVGVGDYEQAGGGSGRFKLQVTMHDGDGKHLLQQISDGRLAWTRTEIAGHVSLRRVDVGRLDEWVSKSLGDRAISPRLTVGAWAELLSTIERDHVLAVVGAKLENEQVWVLTGRLRADRRAQILAESGRTDWPMLVPTRVHVAIRSKPDPSTGFGELLPIRFEFWSDPVADSESRAEATDHEGGRLITLIELYAIHPTKEPGLETFRFENKDGSAVNFINETDRYIELYGVHLTERELRQLRR